MVVGRVRLGPFTCCQATFPSFRGVERSGLRSANSLRWSKIVSGKGVRMEADCLGFGERTCIWMSSRIHSPDFSLSAQGVLNEVMEELGPRATFLGGRINDRLPLPIQV